MSREVCEHGRQFHDNGDHFCEECNKPKALTDNSKIANKCFDDSEYIHKQDMQICPNSHEGLKQSFKEALDAKDAAHAEEVKELEGTIRYYLWLGHGCYGQYGDDGEMQCNNGQLHGFLDFKRQPLKELMEKVTLCKVVTYQQLVEAQAKITHLNELIKEAELALGLMRNPTFPGTGNFNAIDDCLAKLRKETHGTG